MPEARPHVVLITRPQPGARETAARVAALGLIPIVAPLLTIDRVESRLPPPERMAAVLLASGNAVDALPVAYHGRTVLTVGEATARRARDAGFIDVISAGGDASDLAALVRARLSPAGGTLLLTAGQGQSQPLATALRASGYRVARRVVYAARRVAHMPANARITETAGVALFFSAETARHFMRLALAAGIVESLGRWEAITIGAQAAMALEGGAWSRIRVASRPNQDEMLALLR